MSKKEKRDFINFIAIEITQRYGIEKSTADQMVGASVVGRLLDEMPDYFGHRSIYTWAEEVWGECSQLVFA